MSSQLYKSLEAKVAKVVKTALDVFHMFVGLTLDEGLNEVMNASPSAPTLLLPSQEIKASRSCSCLPQPCKMPGMRPRVGCRSMVQHCMMAGEW